MGSNVSHVSKIRRSTHASDGYGPCAICSYRMLRIPMYGDGGGHGCQVWVPQIYFTLLGAVRSIWEWVVVSSGSPWEDLDGSSSRDLGFIFSYHAASAHHGVLSSGSCHIKIAATNVWQQTSAAAI